MNDGESGNGPVVDPAPPRRGLSFHAPRVGLGVVLALLTYGLFRTAPAVDLPIYEVGSVAVDNVIAPFAFRVLKTKDELEKERTAIANAVEQALQAINQLTEAGLLRPTIDRVFDFDQAVEAHRYMETQPANGRIVIAVPDAIARAKDAAA